MARIPSYKLEDGVSINRASILAVNPEIEAMEIVRGDEDIDCSVCANGDDA